LTSSGLMAQVADGKEYGVCMKKLPIYSFEKANP
jgi:hypothetical protein